MVSILLALMLAWFLILASMVFYRLITGRIQTRGLLNESVAPTQLGRVLSRGKRRDYRDNGWYDSDGKLLWRRSGLHDGDRVLISNLIWIS